MPYLPSKFRHGFQILDVTDPTKVASWVSSNITTGTTRTYNVLDRSGTTADVQAVVEASADKPGYYFSSSTTDHLDLTLSTNLLPQGFNSTHLVSFMYNTLATTQQLCYFYLANNKIDMSIHTDNTVMFIQQDGAGSTTTNSINTLLPGVVNTVAVIRSSAGTVQFIINGVAEAAQTKTFRSPTGTPTECTIGYSSSSLKDGAIYRQLHFNRALTVAEIQKYSFGAKLSFADIGATMANQTSGTLTIGKRYRSVDWITDDDFTNVASTGAAANADGAEWTCIATTPTKWTNSSKIAPIGCVLALEPEGIVSGRWLDSSGSIVGTATGASAVNIPLNTYQKGTQAVTFLGDGVGAAAGSSVTIEFHRVGNMVMVQVPRMLDSVPAGGSAYLKSSVALPTWIRPTVANVAMVCWSMNNAAVVGNVLGYIKVGTDGYIYAQRDSAGTAYTNSANAGFDGVCLSYIIP